MDEPLSQAQPPAPPAAPWRRLLRPALGALLGAAGLIAAGQAYAQVGGT